jgi:hypothetical protein
MSNDYRIAVDQLIVEHGTHEQGYWKATLTTEQILARLNLFPAVNRSHHNYTRKVVELHYPGSRFEAIGHNAENGWKCHIKIRSK